MKRKRRGLFLLLLSTLLLLLSFLFLPCFSRDRALMALRIYDRYQEKDSVADALGMEISFPLESMRLFPLLSTYNDHEGISELLSRKVRFTVEYSFGDFVRDRGCSRIYLRDDPLYNAYAGVYLVRGFGESLREEELLRITGYDLQELALPSVGLAASQSTFLINDQRLHEEKVSFAGFTWTVFSSSLVTNGPEHAFREFSPGDIQFGRSPEVTKDYPLVPMEGRIYHTYLSRLDLNLALFILARNEQVLLSLEKEMISEMTIRFSPEE